MNTSKTNEVIIYPVVSAIHLSNNWGLETILHQYDLWLSFSDIMEQVAVFLESRKQRHTTSLYSSE